MGALTGISKSAKNAAGVTYALIAKLSDISITFTDNVGATASTATFNPATDTSTEFTPETSLFSKYNFTPATATANADPVAVAATNNLQFTHTVVMQFGSRNSALRNEIQAMAEEELIVIMVDCNGFAELFGGQCNFGLTLTAGTYGTGAGGDLNGANITLSETSYPKGAYTVESATLALIDPDNV